MLEYRSDIPVLLHARKGGVQCCLLDHILPVGDRTDHSGDLIPVRRSVQEKVQNDRVIISADHIAADRCHVPSSFLVPYVDQFIAPSVYYIVSRCNDCRSISVVVRI